MKSKTKNLTRRELEIKIMALEAQAFHNAYFAQHELATMGKKDSTGSAVIVSITSLSGANILRPVAIRDGLSQDTIAALASDIKRSQMSLLDFTIK